jgi:hypothetical protein
MNSDIFFIHTGSALHSWLNYISSVNRRYVLAENSIKYPVSEYIGTQIDPKDIYLDKLHPDLIDRYIDLRFINKFELKRFECAVEFKYTRIGYTDQLSEKKRIFNDIMRLKLFIEKDANRKGYFLLCGTQLDFIKSFQTIGWNEESKSNNGLPKEEIESTENDKNLNQIEPKGFYTNWFKFKKGETKQIDLTSQDSDLKPVYDDFFTKYEKSFKSEITEDKLREKNPITRLIYLSESSNLKDIPTPMKVGIWEITLE